MYVDSWRRRRRRRRCRWKRDRSRGVARARSRRHLMSEFVRSSRRRRRELFTGTINDGGAPGSAPAQHTAFLFIAVGHSTAAPRITLSRFLLFYFPETRSRSFYLASMGPTDARAHYTFGIQHLPAAFLYSLAQTTTAIDEASHPGPENVLFR